MNTDATKAVNQLIVNLCGYIEKIMESNSATEKEQLPSLIEALAKLVD